MLLAAPPPLELVSASLGQQATELQLHVTTRQAWTPELLWHRGARSLCVTLASTTTSRLCVAAANGRPILRRVPVSPPGPATRLSATVSEKGGTELIASFSPADAGLAFGRFAWSAESRWDGTEERFPAHGALKGTARLLAEPRCFGAAARDREHPCVNPDLRGVVTPTPDEALLTPNAPCTLFRPRQLLFPCYFGVAASRAHATVALLGDSHAEHWRAAVEVVAQARRWRGISLSHSGCPYNAARALLQNEALTAQCVRWDHEIHGFFAQHPELHTVFVSARARAQFAGDPVSGYQSAWRALPKTVRRIYVLRDTPETLRPDEAACVDRRLRRHAPATCSLPRSEVLPPDPERAAAESSAHVRVLDLTRFMCDRSRCPSVIGGVLVRKDGSHLTRAFATTLGPYLLRAVASPPRQRRTTLQLRRDSPSVLMSRERWAERFPTI